MYFCFIDYTEAFDCADHNKLWKILKRREYQTTWPASWEIWMQVKKQHLELDMEQQTGSKLGMENIKESGKEYCVLSPCLFNLYPEYIMRSTGLNEAQVRIKIAEKNINNLRYKDDTTLMAESAEELKSHLIEVNAENEKVSLKLNIQKN